MKPRIDNPIWLAVVLIAVLVVALRVTENRPAYASFGAYQRPPLVLTPKAELKTEAGQWMFAPNVPPPISRKEQRRVVVNWTIKETQAEIAPGVIYDDYWGFEGKVPGPLLRVREGDLVEIHLSNGLNSTHAHNIDFHFVSGPGGGAAALNVMPGQTAVLEARAMAPGLFMFHCASPDIPMHIANGMYGFVLVEPAEGLRPVDKEFFIVQSEIYAHNGDKGHQKFDPERGEKMDAQYVVFNGAQGSLLNANAPHVPLNKSVRLYVGNAGPNYVSSFHVIGQIFDSVYREGDLISPPAHSLQTTLIPAGGSTVVEFTPRVPGTFLLVDHAIFRLHRGAAGSIIADGDKMAAAEIYNPITAAGQPEMSADAHLGNGGGNSGGHGDMGHGDMQHGSAAAAAAATAPDNNTGNMPAEPPVPTPAYGVPRAISSTNGPTPAPLLPAPVVEAPVAAAATPSATPTKGGAVVHLMPGSGNYNAEKTYDPKVVTIKRGQSVTWVNNDPGMVHNLGDDKGSFQSAYMRPDQSWSYTFTKPGTYNYHCFPHPWMKGVIIVR
jgi:copper-containing nitrite reductase